MNAPRERSVRTYGFKTSRGVTLILTNVIAKVGIRRRSRNAQFSVGHFVIDVEVVAPNDRSIMPFQNQLNAERDWSGNVDVSI